MKQRNVTAILVVALGLAMTTAQTPATASDDDTRTIAPVAWFGAPETPVGQSMLTRTEEGVSATLRTSGLAPRETVTLWWVVFNTPTSCSDTCGEDDIFIGGDPTAGLNLDGIAAADIVVAYADGAIANRTGSATLAATLSEGGPVREVLFGTAPTLKDSGVAEVHLVVRSHGPAVPGMIGDQLGSYAGGCVDFLHPPAVPVQVGECADIQFAVHLP